MGVYYYFYKQIDPNKHWTEWDDIEMSKWSGFPDPDIVIKHGAKWVSPPCPGCRNENVGKTDSYFSQLFCLQCYTDYTTFFITREQAIDLQKGMNCNEDLFTSMMDRANQDFIYFRYDY